jgi:hypothetical protein
MTSSPHDCRRPKPRPGVDRDEDPDGLFLAADHRTSLVCLELSDVDSLYLAIVEAATRDGSSLKPAMNGIPGDSFYPSYG